MCVGVHARAQRRMSSQRAATIPMRSGFNETPESVGQDKKKSEALGGCEKELICVEVKSSGYKSHKSLDEFCAKFSARIQNKYLIYTKDYKRENGVDCLPVYMTMFL